MLSQLTETGRR